MPLTSAMILSKPSRSQNCFSFTLEIPKLFCSICKEYPKLPGILAKGEGIPHQKECSDTFKV